jgi:FdhE protein
VNVVIVTVTPGTETLSPPIALEKRAARASALAPSSPSAEEPLRFAAGLYRAQAAAAQALDGRELTGRLVADVPALRLEGILSYVAEKAPPALAAAAAARQRDGGLPAVLAEWWRGGRSGRTDFLTRSLLRPYVQTLAHRGVKPDSSGVQDGPRARCSFCGGLPWVALRISPAPNEGAQRHLSCALCGGVENWGRVGCPNCGQEKPDALPVFQGDRYPNARIETCTSCKVYLKSVDLTQDAHAIPEVDDLASLALDLWADEEGYTRVEPGLAGI